MKLGLEGTCYNDCTAKTGRNIPADRLANGNKEILGLLGDWGEGLQNDMTVLGANPEGTGSVVGLQVQPGEVLVHEDV